MTDQIIPEELPPLSQPCPACAGNSDPQAVAAARTAMADWVTAVREARADFAGKRYQADMPGNPWDQAAWVSSSEYAAIQAARPAAAPPVGCPACSYVGSVPTVAGRQVLDFLSVHAEPML